MTEVKLYEELKVLRGKDKYPSKELEEHLTSGAERAEREVPTPSGWGFCCSFGFLNPFSL